LSRYIPDLGESRVRRESISKKLLLEISRLNLELDAARRLKRLFVGSGIPLEDVFAEAAAELDFRVLNVLIRVRTCSRLTEGGLLR
jgi:hypothetical protein